MTYYLSLRSRMRAGSAKAGKLYRGRPGSTSLSPVSDHEFAEIFRRRDVLFATHGFNVDGAGGINALGWLEQRMAPRDNERFIGVLWPGDWWIPIINYPFEASDAVSSGRYLAEFCNRHVREARSLSFLSHSLGGRVMLEAVKNLTAVAGRTKPVRVLCLTAAAVDNDCLQRQYAVVPMQCASFANLASRNDKVLKYSYPAGDFLSDLFGDNDSPWAAALGLRGPKGRIPDNVHPTQLPDKPASGHGDYMPPSDSTPPPSAPHKLWMGASDFMIRTFRQGL